MKNYKKFLTIMLLTSSLSIWNIVSLSSSYYIPFQNAFGLTNVQQGSLLSAYGIVALFGYFFGGALADRVSPKKLIVFSNYMTAGLGLYITTFPQYNILLVVYLLYGISASLMHWSAFIKSIRMMGSDDEQGKMFGWFQSSHGMLSLLLGYVVLMIFSSFIASNGHFEYVIMSYCGFSIFTGTIIAVFYKPEKWNQYDLPQKESIRFAQIKEALKLPITWMNCVIILCIYFIVSGIAYINPYLNSVYMMPVTWATAMGITISYLFRIICSPIGGALVDKLKRSYKLMMISAGLSILSLIFILLVPQNPKYVGIALLACLLLCAAANLPRCCLHTPLSEGKVPLNILGTVAGIVAAIGYSTDVWVYAFWGNLIDKYGNAGYDYIFMTLIGGAVMLVVISLIYRNYLRKIHETDAQAA